MKDTQPHNHSELKTTLLDRINEEQVRPRSRMFFRSRECFVWTLWLMTVIIGALAVAISLFVMTHHQYALYEATHANFLTFLVDVLPYVWFGVFVLMAGLALYNVRHTRRGYRYSVSVILGSSVVLSVAGGAALQYFGLGYTIDTILGEQMAMYTSQTKLEERLWQQPADGRLIGYQVLDTTAPESIVVFEDAVGNRWRMDVIELFPGDKALLASKKRVRVIGKAMDADNKLFHACGVYSWMIDKNMTTKDLSAQRKDFVQKAYEQKERAQANIAKLEESTFAGVSAQNVPPMQICADIAAVRRISASQR